MPTNTFVFYCIILINFTPCSFQLLYFTSKGELINVIHVYNINVLEILLINEKSMPLKCVNLYLFKKPVISHTHVVLNPYADGWNVQENASFNEHCFSPNIKYICEARP